MCIEQQITDFIGVDIKVIHDIWSEDNRKYLSIDSVKGNKGEKRRRSRSCKDIWKSYNKLKSLNRKQTNDRWLALSSDTIKLFTALAQCEKKLLEYCRTGYTKQRVDSGLDSGECASGVQDRAPSGRFSPPTLNWLFPLPTPPNWFMQNTTFRFGA